MNSSWFARLLADDFQKERDEEGDPPTTIHALCLVNRNLNLFFSRVLYKNLSITWQWSRRRGQQLAKSRHLAVTKELYVYFPQGGVYKEKQPEVDKRSKNLRALLPELLRKMANLSFIHCYPVDFSHVWLRAMEQLPGLESLVLEKLYATHGTAVNKAIANRLETSSVLDSSLAFSALKSLKLHGMQWGLREPTTFWHRSRDVDWPKCIAFFMLNARHLAELHLSMLSLECDNTLEAACREYAARCNDEHLVPLKNLSLDKNMHTPAVSVLQKAFDLSALETIKVSGCDVADAVAAVLEVCAPTVTPNLQRITIDRIPPESWYMIPEITQGRTSFRSDPLCWGRRANVYELARLSRAPQIWLPRPRGFDDGFDYGELLKSVANCDWLTHLALCLKLDHHLGELPLASEDNANTNYVKCDTEFSHSEWDTECSSSRKEAANLAQLEAALPVLCEVLKTLSRLKTFCVHFLNVTWGGLLDDDSECGIVTAKWVAKACPTLQYIAVQDEVFVASWPTHAAGSTEEREPFVQYMTLRTESEEALNFFDEYDDFNFQGDSG
ncbi:hypothetical protein ACQRIU_000628 [Beauveria bassiana]